MDITKVKVKSTGVEIRYNKMAETWVMKSEDFPHPDLADALKGLRRHVAAILLLPQEYADTLSVIGVTISRNDEGEKLTISATKELQGGEIATFNTPHSHALPSFECWQDVEKVLDEAQKYLDGKRAQQNVFEMAA